MSVFGRRQAWHFLIPLLLAGVSCGAPIAHANGVSTKITANQPVTGTVTADGVDNYTFNVTQGTSFLITIAETGTHDDSFVPIIALTGPDGEHGRIGYSLGETIPVAHPAAGPWTVAVSRMGNGTSGGSYRMTLVQPPFKTGSSLSSTATSGTNTRDSIDLYTFTGTTGHKDAISLTPTGGEGFVPQGFVFSPLGELLGQFSCGGSCGGTAKITAAGTYTVVVTKGDTNDVTGTYSLSVQDNN